MTEGTARRRWLVLAIACAFIFLANCIQFQLSAYSYAVIPQFGLSSGEFSQLLMAPMLTAVVMSLPLGSLADRFGPKIVVTAASFVALAGGALRLAAIDYPTMFAAMLLLGFSPAAVSANLTKILGAWFGQKIDRAMGAFYASSSLGIVGALLAAGAQVALDQLLTASIAAMAACTVLWMLFAKDNPTGRPPGRPEPVLKYLNVAARSGAVWLTALALGFGLASTTGYSGFLPQFLESSGMAEQGASGYVTAMITLGSMAGSAAAPCLCARLGAFKPFLIASTGAGALLMVFGWQASQSMQCPVMFCMGFLSTAPAPILQSFPYLLPKIRERYAGSAGGLMATVSMLMAYALPTTCAYCFEDDLGALFVALGILFAASIACLVALPELGHHRSRPSHRSKEANR